MREWLRKGLTVAVVVSSGFVLLASGEESGGDKAPSGGGGGGAGSGASGDVKIKSCSSDTLGQLEAVLTVRNNSSKSSDYFIEVVYESSDGATQLDSTFASVSNLQPGQSAETKALSFVDAPSAGFQCRVVDVNRSASL